MIRIVTDSSSDLPAALVDRHDIEVVPLTIRFGDTEYVDGRDLSPAAFWRELQRSEHLPETAAPSAGQFQDAYRRLAASGADGIVAVCLSAELSATYQSAVIAAEAVAGEIPVEVIDSQAVSMAAGLQVLEAARAAEAGADLATTADAARDAVPKTNVIAALDTIEFLRRGGRVGAAQAFFGGLLQVKPLITFENGVVAPAGRVRTRSRALAAIVAKVEKLAPDLAELALVHGGAEDVSDLLDRLERFVPRQQVIMAGLGPVVGTHAGPGVLGVAYRLR
jgi:DegV family protein with EDD domain